MEAIVIWKENMGFEGRANGFSIPMDATPPLGHNYGANPKEVLLTSLAACAGMDIIGILKKEHQFVDKFCIEAQVKSVTNRHPIVFESIDLAFHLEGSIEMDLALRAVELSQTKFCGISAMLFESVPIVWKLILNGEEVGEGQTAFQRWPEEEVYRSTYEG